jgi:hypothetical protein
MRTKEDALEIPKFCIYFIPLEELLAIEASAWE